MSLKEFKTKLESDAAFRAKFDDAKTEDELLKLSKAEGYDLELLSEDELDQVSGGVKKLILDTLKKAGY